jgi:Tn3 transposase DDE domain-containing protein/sigma-54 interacting transcriptional regulator
MPEDGERHVVEVPVLGDTVEVHSTLMREVLDLVSRIAPSDANVLLTGESGVGKEIGICRKRLHQLRKFLFFVRDGVSTQKYAEEQANQAGCLNVLTNAVIVWNTVYLQAALEALRHEGYPVRDEDLVHLSPTRFAHIHRYGKYVFDVEAARRRAGLRPLRL